MNTSFFKYFRQNSDTVSMAGYKVDLGTRALNVTLGTSVVSVWTQHYFVPGAQIFQSTVLVRQVWTQPATKHSSYMVERFQ